MFRTALQDGSDDENAWQAFQEWFEAVIGAYLSAWGSQENGEAQESFQIRWIQRKELIDASAVHLRA